MSDRREHLRRVREARSKLVALADDVQAANAATDGDPYATDEEKTLRKQRAKDEANQKLTGRVAAAREALKDARTFADRELAREKPTEASSARVRRMLDQGLAPGQIADRARELGDRKTLAAVRDELAYLHLSGEGKGQATRFAQPGEVGRLLRTVDTHLADLEPDRERRELHALIELAYGGGGLKQAEELAVKGVSGDPVGRERIAMAYASNAADA